MIKLKNIEKNNTIIKCDIYPEDSETHGNVIVNILTGEIKSYVLPKGYDWCRSHISHTQRALNELKDLKELPNEKIVMWY